MTSEEQTCPYCNAALPTGTDSMPGERVTCARCGESFTVTRRPDVAPGEALSGISAQGAGADASEGPITTQRPGKGGSRNRLVAGLVLGIMLVMGGLGLAYALMTQDFRRANDKSLTRKSRLRSDFPVDLDMVNETPTPPARREGLGYLPTSTNVLACAYIRDLRFQAASWNLLRTPLPVGGMKLRLEQVASWTGLTLREMDHVLASAVLSGGPDTDLMPPITLVVRTVLEHDQEKVRKSMEATQRVTVPAGDGVKRELYRAKLGTLPVRLWQPDAHTLVIGLFNDELRQVPGKPHDGAKSLPAEVRAALESRLPGAPPLWAVGHSEDWNKTLVPALFKGLKGTGPLADVLGAVRTVTLSATFDQTGVLTWQVQAADAAAAEKIEKAALAPRLKANPKAFSYKRDGAWITAQMPLDIGPAPGPGSPRWG